MIVLESSANYLALLLQEIAARVPGMYLILGSCYLVLGMLGSWMLSPPPLSSGSTPGTIGWTT